MSLQDPSSTTKVKCMTWPTDYVSAAPTSTDNVSVDTEGFRFARIDVAAGTLTNGTSWEAVVQHSSDDAVADAFANIEATPTAKTKITMAVADDGLVRSVVIDLTSCERYLKLSWTENGTFTVSELSATVTLFNPVDTEYLGTEVGGFYP
jgi:hypothetical protein